MILAALTLWASAGCVRLARDVESLRRQQEQLAARVDRMSARLATVTIRQQQLQSDVVRLRGVSAHGDVVTASVVDELNRRLRALESAIERLQHRQQPLAAMPVSAASPEDMFAAAVSAERRGATDVALVLYGQVQQLWPSDEWAVGARVRRAEIQQRQGLLLDAMDELLYVIETYPDSPWTADAYLALARGLLVMGRNLEAERLLRDLTMLFPQSAAAAEGAALLAELLTAEEPVSAPSAASESVATPATEYAAAATAVRSIRAVSAVTDPVVAAPPPE